VGSQQVRRTIAGLVADVLITVGLLAMLFAGYLLVWTNVTADRAAASTAAAVSARLDAGEPVPPRKGEAFGLIYIPRLKQDVWGEPIIEGVGPAQLAKGFGHYPSTPLPGEPGNSALAAHRATHGEPLRYVDRLQQGDLVHVRVQGTWLTYRLVADRLVLPTDTWVIGDQMTGELGAPQVLTLTTCHPRWGSTERWIWWAVLESSSPERPEGL
jgi:sortase A